MLLSTYSPTFGSEFGVSAGHLSLRAMKTRTQGLCPFLITIPFLATTAGAQSLIVPTSDTRTVTAEATEGPYGQPIQQDEETIVAGGFGMFQARASAEVTSPMGFANAFASIQSDILADSITVEGNTAGNGGLGHGFCADAWITGGVVFDVTAPCHFRFHGFVEGYDSGVGQAYLYDSSGTFLGGVFGFAAGVVPFDDSGFLQPGSYSVEFNGNGGYCSPQSYSSTRLDITLDLTPLGDNYCTSSANSSGNAATLGFSGTTMISANDLVLEGSGGPPGTFGLFIFSPTEGATPAGNGTLCVGAPFQRLGSPVVADVNGNSSQAAPTLAGPLSTWMGGVQAGSTWNFQWIFRDSVGAGINLSDGLHLNFFE